METINGINASLSNPSAVRGGKAGVVSAIRSAAEKTGVDFTYLLKEAEQESGLNPSARARGSSAVGLYQFIDQTWLKTVKSSGQAHGLGAMADKITVSADGVARVADEADKKAILALRTDPEIASAMAAELAKSNQVALQKAMGEDRAVGPTELYMAHFLGSGGAKTFLNALKSDPSTPAAALLPQAALANKSVFYDEKTGRARSVSALYERFAAKFDSSDEGSASALSVRLADTKSAGARVTESVEEKTVREVSTAAFLPALEAPTMGGAIRLANGATLSPSHSVSSFSTMVLAQMDMETLGLEALERAYRL